MKYLVVCGFNGTVYSRHNNEENAIKAADVIAKKLRKVPPNTGDLVYYLEVVPANARFTNIVPANNEFGCLSVAQKRWVY